MIKNIVQNAVEASDSNGVIDISAYISEISADTGTTDEDLPAGCYVQIEVKDMGSGMPPDMVAKAFDPFFTTSFWVGLRISAVLGIMRAHNGAVGLKTVQNAGTIVHLFFPVDAKERDGQLNQMAVPELSIA